MRGTPHETRRCPRRHLADHPEVVDVWRLLDTAQAKDLRLHSGHAAEALTTVADARAWKLSAEAEGKPSRAPTQEPSSGNDRNDHVRPRRRRSQSERGDRTGP